MLATLRRLVLVLAAALLPLAAHAASTTDYTDQWWVPAEAGWGMSVLQQRDTLFVVMFVYGVDGRPTWYTASAVLQPSPSGRTLFTGDLYETSGPSFKSPFNAASVSNRKVGTLTFDADAPTTASVLYTVDGTSIAKAVTRQLWAYENYSGSYYGGLVYDRTQCNAAGTTGHVEAFGAITINHTGNTAFAMTTDSGGVSCQWNGSYSQLGRLGTVTGTYACADGTQGTFTLYELQKTISAVSGRLVVDDNACHAEGRIGGVRR